MLSRIQLLFFGLALLTIVSCGKEAGPPVIENISPVFGPAESLITIEGVNLANISEIKFSEQVINFIGYAGTRFLVGDCTRRRRKRTY